MIFLIDFFAHVAKFIDLLILSSQIRRMELQLLKLKSKLGTARATTRLRKFVKNAFLLRFTFVCCTIGVSKKTLKVAQVFYMTPKWRGMLAVCFIDSIRHSWHVPLFACQIKSDKCQSTQIMLRFFFSPFVRHHNCWWRDPKHSNRTMRIVIICVRETRSRLCIVNK